MNKTILSLAALFLVLSSQPLGAYTVTFTNNAHIGVNNTTFDDQNVVITNCKVTVDGNHNFNSLQILNGGVLTHSFSSNGVLQATFTTTRQMYVMSSTNPATLDYLNIDTNSIVVTDISGSITYTNGMDYRITTTNWISSTNQSTQLSLTTHSAIPDGATVLVSYRWLGTVMGFTIFTRDDVRVAKSGAIDVSGKGCAGGIGLLPGTAGASQSTNYPYQFTAGGGGGNGGNGGMSSTLASGGTSTGYYVVGDVGGGGGAGSGPGGAGGGRVLLGVGGTLQVDGKIVADGLDATNAHAGGGAGGGIMLSAQNILGSGEIAANGGAGEPADGGGGGGGVIAIYSDTNDFTGSITAYGGKGFEAGGAGTVYLQSRTNSPGAGGVLLVDNGSTRGASTVLDPIGTNALFITGGSAVQAIFGKLALTSLFIGSNSKLTAPAQTILQCTVTGDATIESNAAINLDSKGFPAGAGPGLGRLIYANTGATGGGGGYGGYGGCGSSSQDSTPIGGTSYGTIMAPTESGSGGGGTIGTMTQGGAGGGAIRLTITGTMSLLGKITANGGDAPTFGAGGGSGGSVYLTVGRLTGSGYISANGGAGGDDMGGGGGGGRVAVYYGTNDFGGSITTCGGVGYLAGGAGTIYLAHHNGFQPPRLIVKNGGIRGTNTPLYVTSGAPPDVLIGGGAAVVQMNNGETWNNLLITSNATLGVPSSYGPYVMNLFVRSNATIQAGGAIRLDGQGYPANEGQGRGIAVLDGTAWVGGGGGHGGEGSSGQSATASGGAAYDSFISPMAPGSGGGCKQQFPASGSAGGGVLVLRVGNQLGGGTLVVDGVISANGMPGLVAGAGGGAGGTVWLQAGTICGSGTISANGGAGEGFGGGGGGGGRIAIGFATNRFAGTLAATGGAGFDLTGGAGTIYVEPNSRQSKQLLLPQLLVINGGAPSADTPLQPADVALNIGGGAVATASSPLTLQSLDIASGGSLIPGGLTTEAPNVLSVTVRGDALVDTNASLRADAAGYGLNNGLGAGHVDAMGNGGGGGYGGVGGASLFGAPGGMTYGSAGEPADFGSPGGMSPVLAGFSQGGGAIRLQVTGTLALNGTISANGADGAIEGAGGGSGGSIWITTQKILGNGSIVANGGTGEVWQGGGGGGGRIGVYAATNFFAGTIAALGGAGAWPGENGSLVEAANLLISGQVTGVTGAPVAGAVVRAGTSNAAVTDAKGLYSVTVPLFWNGALAPSDAGAVFIPASRNYSALASNATGQNFVAASPGSFDLAGGQLQGANLTVNWYGIAGVTYQPLCSTNLVDWQPWGGPLAGSNAPIELTMPVTGAPQLFVRLRASY